MKTENKSTFIWAYSLISILPIVIPIGCAHGSKTNTADKKPPSNCLKNIHSKTVDSSINIDFRDALNNYLDSIITTNENDSIVISQCEEPHMSLALYKNSIITGRELLNYFNDSNSMNGSSIFASLKYKIVSINKIYSIYHITLLNSNCQGSGCLLSTNLLIDLNRKKFIVVRSGHEIIPIYKSNRMYFIFLEPFPFDYIKKNSKIEYQIKIGVFRENEFAIYKTSYKLYQIGLKGPLVFEKS